MDFSWLSFPFLSFIIKGVLPFSIPLTLKIAFEDSELIFIVWLVPENIDAQLYKDDVKIVSKFKLIDFYETIIIKKS